MEGTIAGAISDIEAQIIAEAERRAVDKVALVFARVLLTLSDGKTVDYDSWAQATIRALHQLTAEAKKAAR